jgi:2-haloacid dehalogenase
VSIATTGIHAVVFDVFGTLVDWRTTVIRQLRGFGTAGGYRADWERVADDWRAEYWPAMAGVNAGERPWTVLDDLNRESIERVLGAHGVHEVPEGQLDDLSASWHRLEPWPDVRDGLRSLRRFRRIGTLSNGNRALLTDLARHGDLELDLIFGAEDVEAYKPHPDIYLGAVEALGLAPHQVMLAAAHNGDLAAASALGLRTAFILRATEYGPAQITDLGPTSDWDVVSDTVPGLAEAVGGAG